MNTMKQLAVFVANRPGTLAQICDTLAQNKVNVLGLSVADAVDHAVLRFVVDDAPLAVQVLGETGLLVLDSDVLAVALDNQPGSLSIVSSVLGEAGVNIEYAYGGAHQDDKLGTLFLKVSDTDAARVALTRIGL